MKQIEYKVVSYTNTDRETLEQELNKYGNEGWDLFQVIYEDSSDDVCMKLFYHTFYLKRELNNDYKIVLPVRASFLRKVKGSDSSIPNLPGVYK